METGETGETGNVKRQRPPLSDSEDNIYPGTSGGSKRRRLQAVGQENQSPIPACCGQTEQGTQPDTATASFTGIQVQQLNQRQDGKEEFNQQLEQFKDSTTMPQPTSKSPNSSLRPRSVFLCEIQQKLQETATPSSKQASRIRQEREQELGQLQFQPISENAWLKRTSSVTQNLQDTETLSSKQASRIRQEREQELRQLQFQPVRENAWLKRSSFVTQLEDEAERDGSFTEVATARPAKDADQSKTSTAKMIDQMFEEVLKYAESSGHQNPENELSPSEREMDEEAEPKDNECNHGDELLTFPSSGILSPLSKSVPLMDSFEYSSSYLDFEEENLPSPLGAVPLYSIDAYRSQRQSKLPCIQSLTPALQRRVLEKPIPQSSVNIKEKISALNEEAGKLQTVINQTLQALSCCTDETHGRGSLEEAEAEKLLLVSCEKRTALQAEVARLREERGSEFGEVTEEELVSLKPCRGTVTISNIQLPLKVDFVCSSQSHPNAGRPSHYFFILIRYGHSNIVATPLATAADAQNGDTISFPTTVTLKDIRSTFEIDVEVYSLLPTAGSNLSIDRVSTRAKMNPRRFLNKITISSNTQTSAAIPAPSTRHSSNFSLVGSHKITLASLGHKKFPLDKMKLEGKIKRLLGEEFQDKVPFLSPLEGNIYLQMESEGHSNVQHEGFLTRFEIVSGYGLWNRRYFVLEGHNMYYWDHPNDRETKEAKGHVSLSNSSYQSVRPVKRDSCIRPFTLELVINKQLHQEHSKDILSKCWFSADTKQERLEWMEKLNQALLDVHTWDQTCTVQSESSPSDSNNGNLRESIL